MDELPLEGVPPRLFTCTPSRLATWQDCPRRYRMTYLDRPTPPKGPAWAHSSLGAAVHNALKAWWSLDPAERTVPAARAALRAAWLTAGWRDDAQSEQWRERAADWVADYVASQDPWSDPPGVERTVAMRTETLALSGRVDRIDERGEELVIVDYKTGRSSLTTDDARGSLALAVYAAATGRLFRRHCWQVELHHLPTGQVLTWRHTRESLERHLQRAADIAADAVAATAQVTAGGDRDEAFPPAPGPLCGYCDFRQHCAEGQAARPALAPWAALAED